VLELLDAELRRGHHPSFGLCATCRHFAATARKADPSRPHLCKFLNQPLAAADASRICAEHEEGAA